MLLMQCDQFGSWYKIGLSQTDLSFNNIIKVFLFDVITALCQGIYGLITPYNRKICLEIIHSVLFNNNLESI